MGMELHFHRDIDPHGTLTKLLGSGFVHTEENKVSYYECVGSTHGGDTKRTSNIFIIDLTQGFPGMSQ